MGNVLRRRARIWTAVVAAIVIAALGVPPVVPPAVAAAADAAKDGNGKLPAGELVERRTARSKTVRNADGSLTTVLHSEDIHHRTNRGWSPVNSDLVLAGKPGYEWENASGPFEVAFKETLDEDYLSFSANGTGFSLTLEGARRATGFRGSASAGRSESSREGPSSRLVYDDAFTDVDLRYDVGASSVKETLVLDNADVPTRYEFVLTPQGDVPFDAEKQPDGSWAFFAAPQAGPAFVLSAPFAYDSSAAMTADPARRNATMDVKKVGDTFVIDLAVDAAWLAEPARSFPVFLDPTITIQPTVEDASFAAGCSNCTPFVDERLYIGTSDTEAWRGALQFDLADIPAGVDVSEARLELFYDRWCMTAATACRDTTQQLDAHLMTKAWSTASTTSQLGFDPTPLSSFTLSAGAAEQWMSWDVTATMKAWLAGTQPNHGLLMKRSTEPLGAGGPVPPARRYPEPSVTPKLEVTYVSDAVDLLTPDTLHSNGADLDWTRYTGATGAAFEKYEVHRSAVSGFTPSDSTLLATIRDVDQTSYRDTTAAPSKTFVYKVVANSSPSNGRSVTLPPDGQATKLLQPDAAGGKATSFSYWTTLDNCANYGVDNDLSVGTYTDATWRSAVSFDVSDIPTGSSVTSATLSLWQQYAADAAMTVDVHRATRAWKEGTGLADCTGDGATWYQTDGGVDWTNAGGDFAATPAASIAVNGGEPADWHDFNVSALVQAWVNGDAANLGVILKARNDSPGTRNDIIYVADDYGASPTLRPKLALNYTDGSKAQAPVVAIAAPAADATVSGSVTISAAASDDRRVDNVEFFRDGVSLGSDTAAPFEATWDTTAVANGSQALTAKATDDAGNATLSSAVTVIVENSDPPTIAVTSPSGGAIVKDTVTVSANASDDLAIDRVEFFVDGNRVGLADTTAPYSVAWNTLAAAQPAYDGVHDLTSVAFDSHGQATTSAPVSVTVANTAGTTYQAGLSAATPVPSTMTYDPAGATQDPHGVNVTIANNSTTTFDYRDVVLRYRWFKTDGTHVLDSADISLGSSLRTGKSTTLTTLVSPPPLPAGEDKAQYRLRFDLYDKTAGAYFAAKGNAPLDNPVIVNKAIEATALGLEHYYQYEGEEVGAGLTQLTNVASGNSLLRWTPFSSPGRGLSTVVNLTYNSLEDRSESPAGNNFSLSISGLTRLGLPLDIHPNKADEIAGRSKKYIEFTDGDGTTHRFTGNAGGGWDEPAGVHLYLRQHSMTDATRKWALTRPDRVTFFYDDQGFPTSVEDRNGNRLQFTLEDVGPGQDPGGVKRRVTKVTDAAGVGTGGAPSRSFNIAYYSKSDAKKPQVRGKVKQITDHSGSKLAFDYYEDGNLLAVTEQGGTTPQGITTADRRVTFTYTTPDGSGPAIPAAAGRVDPDPKTSQSTRLFSVRDPRGKETTFTYYGPGSGQLRWKLASRTNRTLDVTSFAYDLVNRVTTVTAPLDRVTQHAYDTEGKVTSIVNPAQEKTQLSWTADRHVDRVTEPTGKFTEYRYNANGYLTDTWDQLRNHTQLDYDNVAVDASDTSTTWKSGRTIPHVSQLARKTNPRGTATTSPVDDYQWTFDYDAVGNVIKATEPEGNPRYTTSYSYNPDGTLASLTDANTNTTAFDAYDANGFPTKVTTAISATETRVTRFGYDDDGLLRWLQDPNHAAKSGGDPRTYRSYLDYDVFHRLRRQSAPKASANDAPLVWSAANYDANDNITAQFAPEYGHGFTAGPRTVMTYDDMDRLTDSTNPDQETTRHAYDDAGRLAVATSPKGVATAGDDQDHAVFSAYDKLDRVVTQTRYDTGQSPAKALSTHYCYDPAGDLVSITAPKADVATVNCAAPPGFTTTYAYDAAHRVRTETDPLGHATSYGYDADGNIDAITNAENNTTRRTHDQRGLPTKVVSPLTATRNLTTLHRYDAVGNLSKVISPRAFDASPDGTTFDQFVTTYSYNAVNQLTRIELPSAAGEAKTFIHRDYDLNGNMRVTTLPDEAATLSAVPAEKKTVSTYFDTGWVRTTNDHVNPAVDYDYNARGQQTYRKAGSATAATSAYAADGVLVERTDRAKDGVGGQKVTYRYDPNNQLVEMVDGAGVTAPGQDARHIEVSYDALDRVRKTRHRKQGDANFDFTSFSYDLNSNVITRHDDGTETQAGALVTAGTGHTYRYDGADWLTTQEDDLDEGCQKISNTFTPLGSEATRVIRRAATGCASSPEFSVKQSTQWTYHANASLDTLTTRNGPLGDAASPGAVVESHDVDYLDNQGVYVNGHRTRDVFTAKGSDGDCAAVTCTATYAYDGRDRLLTEKRDPGPTITYDLDSAGNIRSKATPAATTFFEYAGMRLDRVATGSAGNYVANYRYDDEGSVDCVVNAAFAGGCGAAGDADLIEDYTYDYLNRVTAHRSYAGGAVTDRAGYEYDPLDRVVKQTETHGTSAQRVTEFGYLGLSGQVTREQQTGDDTRDATKTYSYDVYGNRISLTSDPNDTTKASQTYTYGYDVHGSVSLLLDQTGQATASYGYDAYGDIDAGLTKGDPQDDDPLNPYRYTAKRWDPGTKTLDMGARRFSPTAGRFTQPDAYGGALANLGLSTDVLTANRYALAGGNPVSYIEWDGHVVVADGDGGGADSPKPDPYGAASPTGSSAGEDNASTDEPLSTGQRARGTLTYGGATAARAGHVRDAYNAEKQALVDRTRMLRPRVSEYEYLGGLRAASAERDAIRSRLRAKTPRPWRSFVPERGARNVDDMLTTRTVDEFVDGLGEGNRIADTFGKAGKVLGPAAVGADIGMAGYEIYNAPEASRAEVAFEEGGALVGGAAGVAGGAWAGAALGAACGPAAVLCSPAGAIIGGLAGSWAGREAGSAAYEAVENR